MIATEKASLDLLLDHLSENHLIILDRNISISTQAKSMAGRHAVSPDSITYISGPVLYFGVDLDLQRFIRCATHGPVRNCTPVPPKISLFRKLSRRGRPSSSEESSDREPCDKALANREDMKRELLKLRQEPGVWKSDEIALRRRVWPQAENDGIDVDADYAQTVSDDTGTFSRVE